MYATQMMLIKNTYTYYNYNTNDVIFYNVQCTNDAIYIFYSTNDVEI